MKVSADQPAPKARKAYIKATVTWETNVDVSGFEDSDGAPFTGTTTEALVEFLNEIIKVDYDGSVMDFIRDWDLLASYRSPSAELDVEYIPVD